MDLGLDRSDPSRCLDALTDGEETRVDLGDVSGRAFVNTVSFGVYADIVQRPEYRDAKAGTALDLMPDLLAREETRWIEARVDGTPLAPQQALLISNNPYTSPDGLTGGDRRPRLDTGELGVLGIRVEDAAHAADLAVRGSQSTGLTVTTAHYTEVTSDAPEIPVAVDGESLHLPPPVTCSLRPGALRVLLPRDRPANTAPVPPVTMRRLIDLAFNRTTRAPRGRHRA